MNTATPPVSILQFFNVHDKTHLNAYVWVTTHGKFNNSFITRGMNIAFPPGWELSLATMLAQAYLDATMQTADLTDLPTVRRLASQWLLYNGLTTEFLSAGRLTNG